MEISKRGHAFQNLTGKKYGMLTVIRLVSISKSGTKWLLKCDCGNEVRRLASNFKKKRHKHSCGCISKNPGKKDAGLRRLFRDYVSSARRRGHTFSLTFKRFSFLVSCGCNYCGCPPSPRYVKQVAHKILANGIDRINNEKGYTVGNCVPCCGTCNRAKNDMPEKEFLDWIHRVYYYNSCE